MIIISSFNLQYDESVSFLLRLLFLLPLLKFQTPLTLSSHSSGLKNYSNKNYHIFRKPWTSAFRWHTLDTSEIFFNLRKMRFMSPKILAMAFHWNVVELKVWVVDAHLDCGRWQSGLGPLDTVILPTKSVTFKWIIDIVMWWKDVHRWVERGPY